MNSIVFCASLLFFIAEGLDPPIVSTNFGSVRGKWRRSTRNILIGTFLGIPYAKAPVGQLRFENTRPWNKTWEKVRDATSDGPMCPQLDIKGNLAGNEDCLYLNIFVPYNDNGTSSRHEGMLPVLVYVHGGGYINGSNNSTKFGPEYIMNQDVILVVVNYRLNMLGFFSTGSNIAPGNYGIKDVVMALRWIQSNIEHFGGTSKSVTLCGHSVGAQIIHFLSLNNKFEGLFHRLIMQSGSAFQTTAIHTRKNIRRYSLELAKLVGCNDDDNEIDYTANFEHDNEYDEMLEMYYDQVQRTKYDRTIKDCMKNMELDKLFRHSKFYHEWNQYLKIVVGPTLEADNEDAVITKYPKKSISDGTFRDIPWIIGLVANEGIFRTYEILKDENKTLELVENFTRLLPIFIEMQEVIQDTETFAQFISDYYFEGNVGKNFEINITQLVGDSLIMWPSYEALKYQAQVMNSDVFFYIFSYEGTISDIMQSNFSQHYGVSHGNDLIYLFPHVNMIMDSVAHISTSDHTMINILTELFVNFAKNGTPSASLTLDWEPYQEYRKFMRLGTGRSPYVSIEEDILADRMGFWEKLMNNVSTPLTELVVTNEVPTQEIDPHSAGTRIGHSGECIFILLFSFCFTTYLLL